MKKILIFIFIASFYTLPIQGVGTHVVNQTNQPLRVQLITAGNIYTSDMVPTGSYFFSEVPLHMIVYGPTGMCSQFKGIDMNGSIFNYVLIRAQRKNPGCYLVGFTGKTRESFPRTVAPIAFEPDICKRNCWNPTNGWIASDAVTKATTPTYTSQGVKRPG